MQFRKITIIGILALAVFTATAAIAVAATTNGNSGSSMATNSQRQHKEGGALKGEIAKILAVDVATLNNDLKAGKTVAQIASEKGIAANIVTQKVQALLDANIDKAMKSGKLTTDKAAKIKAKTAQKAESMVNNKWAAHERKGQKGGMFKGVMQQIPAMLGIDSNTLKTQMKNGKSLTEIAKEKGLATSDLVPKIQAAANTNIDLAVKEGKITSNKAAEIKNKLTASKIEEMLNRKPGTKQR